MQYALDKEDNLEDRIAFSDESINQIWFFSSVRWIGKLNSIFRSWEGVTENIEVIFPLILGYFYDFSK